MKNFIAHEIHLKIVVAFIIITSSSSLSAQTIEAQKVTDTDSENSVADNGDNSAGNSLEASKTESKQADDILRLKKTVDEQKKLLNEQSIILNKRIDELEEKQNEEELSHISPAFTPSFNMFGFFDLTFNKVKARKGGFFEGMLYDKASFLINNLNLYAKSELTPSLSVLAEIRFTFSPVGEIKSMELTGASEFERVDTQVLNPNTSEKYRLNGLAIERIHLTWKPKDYFGVIAGRFLTPYGIWNIDHGSPVIIGIRAPFSQTAHMVPNAQTGLQVFGTFETGNKSSMEYNLTFSNGRGPMDEVYDLDNDMAWGLRLKLNYDNNNIKASLGAYGYTGKYTDKKTSIVSVSPFAVSQTSTEVYREYIGTVDGKFEFKNFTLQSEFLRRLVKYKVRPFYSPGEQSNDIAAIGYPADFVATSFYVLAAYSIKLKSKTDIYSKQLTLTPYVMTEYYEGNDSLSHSTACNIAGGLNFKPSPYVSIKAEYYNVIFPNWIIESTGKREDFYGISGQLAVSF